MKIFAVVLLGSAILGGLIGGELLDKTFSISGAAIGSVGVFAVLMAIGSFLTSREARRKSSIPPEIGGVFHRMSKHADLIQKTANNKSKQFHMNQTAQERIEWFRSAPEWSELDPKIVDLLCKKFGDDPLFEAFVLVSQEHNLVQKYSRLNNKASRLGAWSSLGSSVSEILSEFAQERTQEFVKGFSKNNQKSMRESYGPACDALETALIIEPKFVMPYLQLATLKSLVGQYAQARDVAVAGMYQIEQMKSVPFEKSELETVKNAPGMLEIIENKLAEIAAEALINIK